MVPVADTDYSVEDRDILVEKLSHIVYQHGNANLRVRAMLCTIYYKALREKFYEVNFPRNFSYFSQNFLGKFWHILGQRSHAHVAYPR